MRFRAEFFAIYPCKALHNCMLQAINYSSFVSTRDGAYNIVCCMKQSCGKDVAEGNCCNLFECCVFASVTMLSHTVCRH